MTIDKTSNHPKVLTRCRGAVNCCACSLCKRSQAESHWRLKPEALGLTPDGTTFLSSPLLFQMSMDAITIGLQTIKESHPSDSSTAVILLVISHIKCCDVLSSIWKVRNDILTVIDTCVVYLGANDAMHSHLLKRAY